MVQFGARNNSPIPAHQFTFKIPKRFFYFWSIRAFLRPATSGGANTGACALTKRGGRRDRLAIRRGAAKTRLITVCVLRFLLPFCGDTLRGDAADDWVRWLAIEMPVATTALVFFVEAWGSDFQIRDNSASALDNPFAGTPSSREDPSLPSNHSPS